MTVQSLSRMLSGTHRSVESGVDPIVSLTRWSSFVQVKDDTTTPEAITIREIFKAPCLQSLRNQDSLVSTFSKGSNEEIRDYLCSLSDECMKKVSGSCQALEKTRLLQKSSSSSQASPTASEQMQKLSHRQKSAVFSHQSYDHDIDKVTSADEQVHSQIKNADKRQSESPSQTEMMRSVIEANLSDPVPVAAQPKLSHIDPLENLIEQLQRELVFLRSQVSFLQTYSCNLLFFLPEFCKQFSYDFFLCTY